MPNAERRGGEERERREGETDTDTDTDTQTQTHRHRHRHRERQTDRQTDTDTERETDRQTDTQTHRHTDTQTHRDRYAKRKSRETAQSLTLRSPFTLLCALGLGAAAHPLVLFPRDLLAELVSVLRRRLSQCTLFFLFSSLLFSSLVLSPSQLFFLSLSLSLFRLLSRYSPGSSWPSLFQLFFLSIGSLSLSLYRRFLTLLLSPHTHTLSLVSIALGCSLSASFSHPPPPITTVPLPRPRRTALSMSSRPKAPRPTMALF